MAKEKRGCNWKELETEVFLELCIEKNVIMLTEGKRHKHNEIYESLEFDMKRRGFIKTGAQMRIKLKHLKETYYKCIRSNKSSAKCRDAFAYFDYMHHLMRNRPSSTKVDSTTISTEYEDGNELVLNDVEVIHVTPDCVVDATDSDSDAEETKGPENKTTVRKKLKEQDFFAESMHTLHAKQTEMLMKVLQKQHELQIQATAKQLESQRQWDRERMLLHHKYQMQEMQVLINGFLQGLQSIMNGQLLEFPVSPLTPVSGQSPNYTKLEPSL